MSGTFYVKDYGAIANDGIDDRVAIQKALNAAAAAGGGTVVLDKGVYDLTGDGKTSDGCLQVRSNITLQGAGMQYSDASNCTVLHVMDGSSADITGVVRTPVKEVTHDVTLTGFTIDGNRDSTAGKVDAFFCGVLPGDPRYSSNITINAVEAKDCSGYGFDPHEQTHNLTLQNSVAHGNGLDGFVADFVTGGVYENDIAFDNDRHGFNICTSSSNITLLNDTAYGNGSAGVCVQRGSDNVPWVTHVTVQGGSFHDNVREGILIKMSDSVTVKNADIFHNGRHGISVAGSTHTLISGDTIHDNSLAKAGYYDEVRIAQYDDTAGASGQIYKSASTTIDSNHIIDTNGQAGYGVQEMADGSNHTAVTSNTIYGEHFAAIKLADPTSLASGYDSSGNTAHGPVVIATSSPDGTPPPPPPPTTIDGTSGNDTLTGTPGNDTIHGLGGNDTLSGLAGNDILDGGTGADTMIGSLGDDTYYVDNTSDVVVEKTGEGNDTIFSSVNFIMNSNMENLTLTGSAISANGSSNNNSITGNAMDNSILGASGNDKLLGMAGNDYLSGGTGNDLVDGGQGNDDLRGGDGNDTVIGGAGVDQLYGGTGTDGFIFKSLSDSGVSSLAAMDGIHDFNHADGDKIDLSALGHLTFIQTSAFTHSGQGEVDYHYSGSNTIISVDADGNGTADTEIAILSQHPVLTTSDFVFG